MNKAIALSVLVTLGALTGIVYLLQNDGSSAQAVSDIGSNVTVVGGKQTIRIDAKGGYLPRNTVAKANMLTTLDVRTNGTFDCSSAIAIPSLGYRKELPASGVTSIEIPPQPAGTTLKGLCAMGMYNFSVNFN